MTLKATVLVDSLRFPECPRWHAGELWCSDMFAQRVVRIDLHGGVRTVVARERKIARLPITRVGVVGAQRRRRGSGWRWPTV